MECVLFQLSDEWDKEKVESFCRETLEMEAKVIENGGYLVVKMSNDFKEPVVGEHRLIRITPTISFIVKEDPEIDQFVVPIEPESRPNSPLTCVIPPDEFKADVPEDFKRLKIDDFDVQSVLAD